MRHARQVLVPGTIHIILEQRSPLVVPVVVPRVIHLGIGGPGRVVNHHERHAVSAVFLIDIVKRNAVNKQLLNPLYVPVGIRQAAVSGDGRVLAVSDPVHQIRVLVGVIVQRDFLPVFAPLLLEIPAGFVYGIAGELQFLVRKARIRGLHHHRHDNGASLKGPGASLRPQFRWLFDSFLLVFVAVLGGLNAVSSRLGGLEIPEIVVGACSQQKSCSSKRRRDSVFMFHFYSPSGCKNYNILTGKSQ